MLEKCTTSLGLAVATLLAPNLATYLVLSTEFEIPEHAGAVCEGINVHPPESICLGNVKDGQGVVGIVSHVQITLLLHVID